MLRLATVRSRWVSRRASRCSDDEGDNVTITITEQPTKGTAEVVEPGDAVSRRFAIRATSVGPDSFKFKASDGNSDSNVATVTTNNVPAVNDPPQCSAPPQLQVEVGDPPGLAPVLRRGGRRPDDHDHPAADEGHGRGRQSGHAVRVGSVQRQHGRCGQLQVQGQRRQLGLERGDRHDRQRAGGQRPAAVLGPSAAAGRGRRPADLRRRLLRRRARRPDDHDHRAAARRARPRSSARATPVRVGSLHARPRSVPTASSSRPATATRTRTRRRSRPTTCRRSTTRPSARRRRSCGSRSANLRSFAGCFDDEGDDLTITITSSRTKGTAEVVDQGTPIPRSLHARPRSVRTASSSRPATATRTRTRRRSRPTTAGGQRPAPCFGLQQAQVEVGEPGSGFPASTTRATT